MKIAFKSVVKMDDTDDIVTEYITDANSENYEYDGILYKVYTYKEFGNGPINRIELNENNVNIFREKTSIITVKNKKNEESEIDLGTGMTYKLISELINVENFDKGWNIHYILYSLANQKLSECYITIIEQ
ncbi:Uncharacterised protein [Mycoplasmopsis maculosa]|uniref:DUF1934 domain-containing protein n=1 Tax=Mycoplasmopsis maculosa TaxID=114885 RepID=A0A449B437_9BACT|nr:hypothetical protein [Mycoplasmopsis maculosa]VEU75335.1 Uncharacterised protein [Mycoplasmopsis maculosa]